MSERDPRNLFLPRKDRSFWQAEEDCPVSYLAWGRRNFHEEYLPPCRHEGWVCFLIEEGSPDMIVLGKTVTLNRGMLVIIGPDCPFGWASKEGNHCKFILWMWRELDLGQGQQPGRDTFSVRPLSRRMQRPLLQIHEQCRLEVMTPDAETGKYLLGCRISFEALLSRILTDDSRSSSSEERFKLADNWISGHLDSNEPVARLCDYLDLSQSSLHRLFKAEVGMSPASYFRRLKMEHARRLLRTGNYQVKEIAFQLGYSQFNDFSRAYKQHFGCAPSSLRGYVAGGECECERA